MTALTKALTRTVTDVSGKPLIVTLTVDGILFRRPRQRKSYLLPYGHGELRAQMLEAGRVLDEKGTARKTRAKRVSRGLLTIGR